MTVGSRMEFMRFATVTSPKLQRWIDHFDQTVGHAPRVVSSGASGQAECIVVWQLVSANSRILARSASLFTRFDDARADALATIGSTASREIVLTNHQRRGGFGWYSLLDGEVEMTCARWYGTERDRRKAIELSQLSLVTSHLTAGARPIDPEVHRGQYEFATI